MLIVQMATAARAVCADMTGKSADKWTILLLPSSSVPAGLRGGTGRRLRGAPLIAAAPATRRMAAARSCPAGTPPRCGTGRHRDVTTWHTRYPPANARPSGQPPTPLFQQQHATPQQRHGPGQDSCIFVLEMVVPAAARLLGSARESARSTSWCSLSSFCTMNCARSPTTLLLGVTCAWGNSRVTLHRLDQSALQHAWIRQQMERTCTA